MLKSSFMVRRRDGGDVAVRVFLRRRDGGDVEVFPRMDPPVVVPERDYVSEFLGRRPFYISHRLGGAEYPEFTERGLRASLDAGFKALELSVRRCASGEFVLIHDWVTSRTVPGTDYQIWNTPWSTLKTLSQASGPFMTLEDALGSVPGDVVLAIDHKVTSDKPTASQGDLEAEEALFALLEARLGVTATKRVLWKHFCKAGSVERAKARGYRTMCMLYSNELADADLSAWDVLGMEWNAPEDAWATLRATGRPLVAHIVTNTSQVATAMGKGASGFMASYPSVVHP